MNEREATIRARDMTKNIEKPTQKNIAHKMLSITRCETEG